MQIFTYIATDKDGREVSGSKYASDRAAVEGYITDKGYKNAEIFVSKTGGKGRVNHKELAVFCRMMSVVFISHITLSEGLKLISDQTDNKELRSAIEEIYQFIDTGYTFSQSICMYPHIFGSYPVNMITVGEASGTLDDIFSRLSVYFDKEDKIKRKLKSAISYPLILTVFMTAIIVLLIVKIIPMFESTLASIDGVMPISALFVFRAAHFISRYFIAAVCSIAVAFLITAMYMRTKRGRFFRDKLKISAPIFKYLNTRIITSRYARGLSILLKSGVQLINAMQEIILLVNNSYLEKRFNDAVDKVKEGVNLTDVFSDMVIFPPLFIRLVTIGHSAGLLDEMLERSAAIFDEEVDHAIERLTLTVEPLIIIILSIAVGIILLSVMLPMIGIMNAIG